MADFSTVVATQVTQAVTLNTVQQVVQVNSSVPGSYADVGDYLGVQFGTGSPEGVVTAPVGDAYHQTDGAYGVVHWVKASGSGNTGWRVVPLSDQRANAQRLLGMLTRGVEDATFLLISDSTGTSTYWSPTFFNALAALFPAYTVTLRYWNNTTFQYGSPSTLQTGSGSFTLNIYNCSISGANTATFLDQYFEDRIAEVLPDYVMISMGHNENPTAANWGPQYLELLVSVQQACPQASLCLIAQNPATADQNQELRAAVYGELAQLYGCGFLDICQIFNENGGAAVLTTDGVHPNAAGSALWAAETLKAFRYADTGVVTPGSLPWLDDQELLVNGDFSRFAGSVPDGWVAVGSPTVSQDTVNFESPNDYSVSVQATGGVAGYLQQSVPHERLAGRWVTLIARVRKATDTPTTSGRIGIYDGSGSIAATQSRTSFVYGAFRWIVAQRYIDPASSAVTVFLYGDTSTTNGGASFDRVSLRVGRVPKLGVYQEAVPAARVQAGTFGPGTTWEFGNDDESTLNLDLNATDAATVNLRLQWDGIPRWIVQMTTGGLLNFLARDDSGASIGVPWSLGRLAGVPNISDRRIEARRFAGNGTAHVAGDYVASANWGTSPTITPSALDTGGRVSIVAQATTGANPTLALTFKDGTWTTAPAVSYSRGDTNTTAGYWVLSSIGATVATWTFVGTPTAGETYTLDFTVIGK